MNLPLGLKRVIGKSLLNLCEWVPAAKPVLKPWGLRTSPAWFGNRMVRVQMPGGRSFKLASLGQNYLSFELFWRGAGYYEPITALVAQELVRPGDTFIDIGANIGFYSLMLSACHPGLRGIAFEPNEKMFQLLQANVQANGFGQIVCEPLAISDLATTAMLHLSASDMSASLEGDFDARSETALKVSTTSLDCYLAQHPQPGRLLIKVDVEGHEAAFFKGAQATLAHLHPDVIVEITSGHDDALQLRLKQAGYHFYQITDQGLLPSDTLATVFRDRFVFLNYLLSARPEAEIADVFRRIEARVRRIDLTRTSKCVAPEMIQRLRARQSAAAPAPQTPPSRQERAG